MWTVPKPLNERQRLEALRRLRLLDVVPDVCFEAVTRCAKAMLDVPVALISLIDDDRQWFMCKIGVEAPETPRALSFCAHAIHTADPFVVPDATQDARFSDHPLVVGPPFVRSYLGIPLVTSDAGFALGTLCVVDSKARDWSEAQIAIMSDLAKITMTLVEVREFNRELHEAALACEPAAVCAR